MFLISSAARLQLPAVKQRLDRREQQEASDNIPVSQMLLSSEPSAVCLLHQPPSQLGHSKMNCRLLEKCTKLFSSCLGSREYVLPIVLNSESFFSIKLIYRISHSSRRVVERQWVTAWQRSSKHVQQTLIKSRPGMRMEGSEGGRKRREDGWTSKWYLFLVQERQQPRSSTQPNSQRAITRQAFCLLRPNPSRAEEVHIGWSPNFALPCYAIVTMVPAPCQVRRHSRYDWTRSKPEHHFHFLARNRGMASSSNTHTNWNKDGEEWTGNWMKW